MMIQVIELNITCYQFHFTSKKSLVCDGQIIEYLVDCRFEFSIRPKLTCQFRYEDVSGSPWFIFCIFFFESANFWMAIKYNLGWKDLFCHSSSLDLVLSPKCEWVKKMLPSFLFLFNYERIHFHCSNHKLSLTTFHCQTIYTRLNNFPVATMPTLMDHNSIWMNPCIPKSFEYWWLFITWQCFIY